jgi:hypothetical protein
MNYSASKIEVTRFFGRKGGEGIGCCAIDLIQGFVNDPDAPAKMKLVHGDSGTVLQKKGKAAYLGKTNHELFLSYLRIGTFSLTEMPNRIFLASLTESQCNSVVGQKWLKILKENGFEFIRATDNSVYSGNTVTDTPGKGGRPIYLFGLFRNISSKALEDPFKAPAYWDSLPPMTMTPNKLWLSQKTVIYTEDDFKEESATKAVSVSTPVSPFTQADGVKPVPA